MGFCRGPVDVEPFQNLYCNHEMICTSCHLVSGTLRGGLHCNLWLPLSQRGNNPEWKGASGDNLKYFWISQTNLPLFKDINCNTISVTR